MAAASEGAAWEASTEEGVWEAWEVFMEGAEGTAKTLPSSS